MLAFMYEIFKTKIQNKFLMKAHIVQKDFKTENHNGANNKSKISPQ